MARYNVWFCRFEGILYSVVTDPPGPGEFEEPPSMPPRVQQSVGRTLRKLKFGGHEIAQVGILPPELIGLEDIEV